MSNEDVDREVQELCGGLTADPIFAMSLGSKELFHSNLLGWFLEHHPAVADAVVSAWSVPGGVQRLRVEREQRHLDLLVEVPGYASVVVENEMFALPDEAQLAPACPHRSAAEQEPNPAVALGEPAQQGERVSTTAAIALLLLGSVLLAPVTLTALGARRRGQRWHIALVSVVLFPVAWTLWCVADEHPFSRRPPGPR